MPGSMTPTPQQMSPPTTARATTAGGDDPSGTVHADRLWAALINARAGDLSRTRVHTEDAVFRFYLPMAHALARSSARYPHDPEGAEQAAELGLAQVVLAWRRPTGQGFDRAARAAILHQLQQGRARTAQHPPARATALPGNGPTPTTPSTNDHTRWAASSSQPPNGPPGYPGARGYAGGPYCAHLLACSPSTDHCGH